MSTRANLRTAIVVETLPRGRWLAWPLAAPDLVQYGKPEEDPRLVMALFLPEHLKTLPGTDLSRFATPPGTKLATAPVALERPELPARLKRGYSLAVPWVVTPYGRDLWLHILPLRLVVRAEAGDDLEAMVASEVRRVVLASEPSPDEVLALLPTMGHRLEWLDIVIDERGAAAREAKTAVNKAIAAEEAHGLMLSVASARHADRRLLEGPPLVSRPRDLEVIDRLLQKGSVLVHGPELAGKTALIEGWIRARVATPEPRDPTKPPSLLVYATSGARLMAGMSLLGQWQERLRRVLTAVETLGAVLQIEHLGELLGDSGMGQELANALRPWLEDRRVRLVTELRDSELDRLERQHPALLAVLQRVRLAPLGRADTLAVLDARRAHLAVQEPERPRYTAVGNIEILALSDRYQPQLAQPGSAVRLSDELRNLVDSERDAEGRAPAIDAPRTLRAFATLSGLPPWLLDDARPFDVSAMRTSLSAKVVGQDAAVRAVAESLAVVKTRLAARGKPLGSFLFAGPTGVGKTELARALAIELFGSESRLARFDMSEFMDAAAAERLIRGGDGMRDGLLTRRLRKEPLSVVLLDEIEKAHKSVFDLLLQALGEGRLTDASGRTASLEGCIVVLTSNLGATDRVKKLGLVDGGDELADHYLREIRKSLSPEFLNRIERIIPFAALGADALRKVVRLQVQRVARRRGLHGIELAVDDAALDFVAAAGTTPQYGARALRRAVDKLLVAPLAHTIARQPAGSVARVAVRLTPAPAAELVFEVVPRVKSSIDLRPIAKLSQLRRQARAHLRRAAVGEVRERIELIEAELMRGASAGPLLAERARLSGLVAPFDSVVSDLEQLEDLVYLESDSGRAKVDLTQELAWAELRSNELNTALFELLTAIHGRHDHALLALTELDDGRAFDRWLVPLLETAETRRWQVRAWIEGEHDDGRGGAAWPYGLPIGPPRSAAELYLRVMERPSDFRHLIIGLRGPHAGTLMACEAGLIAFRPPATTEHAHLLVKPLSFSRAELTPEIVRAHEALFLPPPLDQRGPMANGKIHRHFFQANGSRLQMQHADSSRQVEADAHAYFALWETYAAQQLLAFDEHATRDRSELFVAPLEDEIMFAEMEKLVASLDRY